MASIYDVAKMAKVSPSTVSRIINGARNVAPATAEAVEAAIAKVGYVKRAVRPGRKPVERQGVQTGIIDFLSLGSHSPAEMFSMPVFPRLLDGIMRGVESHRMDLVLSHCPHELAIPPVLARRRADGVLLFGNPGLLSPQIAEMLKRIPFVWCFLVDHKEVPDANYVLYDNAPIGRMAADYLVDERGHRKLAFLSATPENDAFKTRRESFSDALREKGLTADVIECNVSPPYPDVAVRAKPLIDQLLSLNPRPTGVFCVSDDLMLAVFNGLRQRGIEPGRDMELIGCNNDAFRLEQMHPRPATIDLKLDEVGREALELLRFKMSDASDSNATGRWISPSLVPAE